MAQWLNTHLTLFDEEVVGSNPLGFFILVFPQQQFSFNFYSIAEIGLLDKRNSRNIEMLDLLGLFILLNVDIFLCLRP